MCEKRETGDVVGAAVGPKCGALISWLGKTFLITVPAIPNSKTIHKMRRQDKTQKPLHKKKSLTTHLE